MRKITKQAVDALLSGSYFCKDNTLVIKVGMNQSHMILHKNRIAIIDLFKGSVTVSNAGWPTVTTKERLNGLLSTLGLPCIYQKNFVWYWGDGSEFENNTTLYF